MEPFAKHAAQDTPDETWLKLAGTNGWVVLTGDDRIRYHAAERQALVDAKVAAFILGAGNLTGDQQASVIVAALPEIKRHLRANDVPIVATITKSGAVQLKKNE